MISAIMFLIYIISVVITGFYISLNHKELVSHVNENNIKNNRSKMTTKEEYLVVYMFAFLPIFNSYLTLIIISEAIIKLIRGKD
jgi:hypothetical protein